MPFTFKINNPTGKYRSFDSASMDIKIKGKICGIVHEPSRSSLGYQDWRITFTVLKKGTDKDNNPNCSFKTIVLKYKPTSFDDAKKWLNERYEAITEKWELYFTR